MNRTVGRVRVFLAAILPLAVICAGSASAGRVNFAKYQKVTASSQDGTYAPDLAVDGIASNFHSFRTGATGPHWIEFGYPRQITLASAHLFLGLNNIFNSSQVLGNFKFQYHNGANWIDVPGASVTGNTQTEVNLIFAQAVTSDRFRLWTDNTGIRIIREIAMFPPNLLGNVEQGFPIGTDVILNLAYKRPATASTTNINSQYGPGYAKNAFDGYIDNKSRWECTSATGQWLEVDLLDTHTLGSAHVYTGFIGPNDLTHTTTQPLPDFKLQSWNGSAWVDIPGSNITGNTQVARTITFSSNVSTSKVRIVTTSASNGRVQELLLLPPRAGGYTLGREVIDAAPPTATWDDYSDSSYLLRCGITDGRLLGYDNNAVRFSAGSLSREALGWQLLLNYRDGSYRIRHNATGKCLALSQISTADQNPVLLEDYTGLPHQDWFLESVDATYFRIVNSFSGMALQTRYGDWTLGNPMAVRPVDGGNLQKWQTQDAKHHPKKGIAASHNTAALVPWGTETWMQDSYQLLGEKTSWSYTWGRQTSDTFPFMSSGHAFNPMQWGNFNWNHSSDAGPMDLLRSDVQGSPKPVYLMGFNEPDKTSQGYITVPNAIMRWPRLEAMEIPLVSPCPANAFDTWNNDFKSEADDRGYRRDYTAIHIYAAPNADNLISQLQQAYNQFGRPVWLTEFSAVDWGGTSSWTLADNYDFLAEFMWRAESLPWLKRYSLFQFAKAAPGVNQSAPDLASAPRSNARNVDGTLTAFGQLYAGWDGVTGVRNDKAYHLHNRGSYKRLKNPVSGDAIASVNPDGSASSTQWFLIPGTTAGTVRICSTVDGRRLRYFTGTGGDVGLATAGNTQLQTEWRYVADQYGWYYIEHPNTSLRLGMNGGSTFVMGAIGSSGDSYKWRFAVPAASEPVDPPAAPSPLTATPATGAISLSWPAVPGAATYTVHRSTSSGGPWQLMAAGLTATLWANTGLPYETQYFYTVTAANALGSSLASSPASATTLHPFASYGAWQQLKLGTFPALGQTPDADADNDGMRNFLEFAFLTDPALPNGSPFLVKGTAAGTITLEFPWNWRATGIMWKIRHGSDFTNVAAWPVVAPGVTTIIRVGDIDRITVTPAMAHPGRGFYILEASAN